MNSNEPKVQPDHFKPGRTIELNSGGSITVRFDGEFFELGEDEVNLPRAVKDLLDSYDIGTVIPGGAE